jgi:hypothetical protein|tara:strand:+ start:521 stop:1303 length:783 start_codon:yes stop_codon:yes gene_type:complete
MKELYSFQIKRKAKLKTIVQKENAKGKIVESTKTTTKTISHKVIFAKPSYAEIENAEFFYGQQYNDYINAGYLTRYLLNKKIEDAGGGSSKSSNDFINKAFVDNMEAAKVIEFYEGQKDLDEEQKKKLEGAKEVFVETQKNVADFEEFHRIQYNQTAEAKSEQKLIEWFIFNFSYYEDKIKDSTETFPLFVGDDFTEKREHYLQLCEDEEDLEDPTILKNKGIFDLSFETLAKVANLWYNKMGSGQKEIEESIKEVFGDG